MILVGLDRVDDFLRKHGDARRWFENWIADVREFAWKTPTDLKARYPKASILPKSRGVIFDVKGNDYRMHVKVNYATGVVLVVRVGTHREYDGWTY